MLSDDGIPPYLQVTPSKRKYIGDGAEDEDGSVEKAVFSVQNYIENEYDVYERDIAVATFYFDESHVFEFIRQPMMNWIGYISQIGGLFGLCLGFSFVSALEIIYWFTYKLGSNM